jgi:hypothetical protein
MMKQFGLSTKKFTCVQSFACCTTMKIQVLTSAKHVGMLGINPKLIGEGLLSHIEK